MMTVKEVAESLRVSPSLVYQLIESQQLACHRIGGPRGAIRISATDVAEYLVQCRQERKVRTPRPPRPRLKHLKL